MKDHEREILLERAEREGATLGANVPETVELDGEEFALNEYVFEARAGNVNDVKEKKKLLRRKRLSLLDKIRDGDISFEEGERVAERIAGIDRALNVLEGIGGSTGIEAEARAAEKADEKRWLNFVKKVTGSSGEDERR